MARTDDQWELINGGTAIQTIDPAGYDILINGSNHYLNFNSVVGSSGYGFRDNAGTMEFKNSGGAWTALGGGGAVAGSDTQIIFNNTGAYTGDSSLRFDYTNKVLLIGSTAAQADFTGARAIFSQADTGLTSTQKIGVLGEALASGSSTGRGVYGAGMSAGSLSGIGIYGTGLVGNTSDTATVLGGSFLSNGTHTGGDNYGIQGVASGSSTNNIGAVGTATTTTAGTNYGGNFQATGGTTETIGVYGKAVAIGTTNQTYITIGTWGYGATNGGATYANSAAGGYFEGHVSATGDTGAAYGLYARSIDTHAGGINYGIYTTAANGSSNFSLYAYDGIGHFGKQAGGSPLAAISGTGIEIFESNTTTGGQLVSLGNTSNGTSAYSGFNLNNDLANGSTYTHFAGLYYNSSGYTDTSFGTAFAVANQLAIQNTDGRITYSAQLNGAEGFHNWLVRGTATTNEMMRLTNTELTVGLAGTTTGKINFAGSTSTFISIQGQAVGNSSVLSLFPHTANISTTKITTEATNTATVVAIASTNHIHTITALASANTFGVPTITSGTLDEQYRLTIRIKDNGTARGLSWNAIFRASSDLALPTTTVLGKTLYLGFQYNAADTKWDLIALLNNF